MGTISAIFIAITRNKITTILISLWLHSGFCLVDTHSASLVLFMTHYHLCMKNRLKELLRMHGHGSI